MRAWQIAGLGPTRVTPGARGFAADRRVMYDGFDMRIPHDGW
jgi:hypothetical protein